MSATMHLYKINPIAYKLSLELDNYSISEIKKIELEDEEKYFAIDTERKWSDDKEHSEIDISYLKALYKSNSICYTFKNLKPFLKYSHLLYTKDYITRYITVDEVSYWQGWDLKNSFFNKKCTFVYCINKKQMYKFMYRYVSPKLYKYFIEKFIDKMVEGEMIFECVW